MICWFSGVYTSIAGNDAVTVNKKVGISWRDGIADHGLLEQAEPDKLSTTASQHSDEIMKQPP